MSRLIRGNLYEKQADNLFHVVSASAMTKHGASSVFHDNFDADGRARIGSLVICRNSALGAGSTGVVCQSFSTQETRKMGCYGQMIIVRSPEKSSVRLVGNYDVIDFQDVEPYMHVLSDSKDKQMEFLTSVKETESLKNTMVRTGELSGSITGYADAAIHKANRPMPAMSMTDIDMSRSYGD